MRPKSKPENQVTVSVRDLVEFVLRTGNLGGDRDFVGAARAREGIRGHQRIQRARPPGYESEVAVSHRIESDGLVLVLRGRIDGVLRHERGALIEEIKTVLGAWSGEPDPLHWAQGKVYGALYARQHALEQVEIQLTYLDLVSEQQTVFKQSFAAPALAAFLAEVTAVYCAWARQQLAWQQQRNRTLQALSFPYAQYRPGQRRLAVTVYRAIARRGQVLVEAPTGVGKTISVLFPALKALGLGHVEKIFYLTAKTSGLLAVAQALADLRRAGLRLRAVFLTAKDKICFNEGQPCDPNTCPYALGYYDRIKTALPELLAQETLDRPAIEAVARRQSVCPYALSLDASLWADAIIGDYNYVFDPKVCLRRHFAEEGGDYALLVDEAHNLVDRAREMFSAELERSEITEVERLIRSGLPTCARALARLQRAWTGWVRTLGGAGPAPPALLAEGSPAEGLLALDLPDAVPLRHESSTPAIPALLASYPDAPALVARDLPRELLPGLGEFLRVAELWLAQNRPADYRPALLELYFRVSGFLRTTELYDEHYVTLTETGRGRGRLRLFCLDPSAQLEQALKRGGSVACFSGTLTPLDYFHQVLGCGPQAATLQLGSPFPAENLAVLVDDSISTHFKERHKSYATVAGAIGALVDAKRGNYMVYFPSYQYLNEVWQQFHADRPACRTLVQAPGMTESERQAFLVEFREAPANPLVGFAVMGGVFGEGIDLMGERLVGAVVVGVGLPQLCQERDLIRAYFQQARGAGFDYAYRFPGMNRVMQALGRVIRSEGDRGVVLLIDRRFTDAPYRRLFPPHWTPRVVRTEDQITAAARHFWSQG